MKKLSISLAVMAVALFSVAGAQNKLMRVEAEQLVVGSNLYIDIYATKLSGPDIVLASGNFSMTFNTSALDVAGTTLDATQKGPYDFATMPSHFWPMTFGKLNQHFSMNLVHRTDNPTAHTVPVTSQRVRLGRVVLPINDPSAFNTSIWRVAPVEVLDWNLQRLRDKIEWVNPTPNFPLCEVPQQPQLTANGDNSLCPGETRLLSTNWSGDHVWYRDGVELQGQTGSSLLVTDAATYSVVAKNYSCTSSLSSPLAFVVGTSPDKPVITVGPTELTSNATSDLQWYFNGNPIPGATLSSFQPTENGTYTLSTTNSCGTAWSDPVEWNKAPTSVVDVLGQTNFSIYPNPYVGQTTFSYSLNRAANVSLEVYDAVGKLVATLVQGEQKAGTYEYSFGGRTYGLSAGTYTLRFSVDGQSATSKLVELR